MEPSAVMLLWPWRECHFCVAPLRETNERQIKTKNRIPEGNAALGFYPEAGF